MWKGGSEQQLVTPFPVDPLDPVDPVDPLRVPKYGFTIVKQHFDGFLTKSCQNLGFLTKSCQNLGNLTKSWQNLGNLTKS